MTWKSILITLAGACLGGFLGYHGFLFAFQYGFYAMILPGAFIGLGASFGRSPSIFLPILCAVAALALSFFLEWHTRPFSADPSLPCFIRNIPNLTPVTLIMIAAGTLLAFWIPFRARRRF